MTRRCGKRQARRKARSGMPRMLSRIDSFPLHRIAEYLFLRPFPPCSPNIFPPPFSLPRPSRLFLSLSLRTYSVFSSPRPIYLPPRVAEWILFVSHRYFSGPACRSSSKTVSPPRFMFPPTQRRIDPFLLSDVYVCGSVFLPRTSLPPFAAPVSFPRSGASTDLPRTRLSVPARHALDGLPVPLLRLLSKLLFSGSVTLSPPAPSFSSFDGIYRLVTSVSRARDLRAGILRWTIEHYFLVRPEAFTS